MFQPSSDIESTYKNALGWSVATGTSLNGRGEKKPWLLGEFEGRRATRHQGGEWGTDARDGARTGVSERLPSAHCVKCMQVS
jgi:hypothetical protein